MFVIRFKEISALKCRVPELFQMFPKSSTFPTIHNFPQPPPIAAAVSLMNRSEDNIPFFILKVQKSSLSYTKLRLRAESDVTLVFIPPDILALHSSFTPNAVSEHFSTLGV